MTRVVRITYRRTFPFPLDRCYGWLTDYDDDDPLRAGAIVKARPVRSRTKDKVVMDGTIETLGREWTGHVEVDLLPPDHWRARLFDKRGREGSVYDYRLTPADGGGASLLTVHYDFPVRRFRTWLTLTLGRPKIRRELDKMWDGFAASMDKELGRGATGTGG